ncbi:hypothetical protein ASPCAL07964 [Aspergillus calidoustus]|uniref:Uncharacterized protein n=1 Tax=Aspergillus calidoustus TaxID=454130 RepID=A0A0U5GTA8_ASPCI|nr:hypothetical protein ASPCAL07964 [Aspergillus calidoustus]
MYGPKRDDSKRCIRNPDLWNFLARHRETLEYLDIFRKQTGGSREMGRLGPLTDFTRLTHLCIQPDVLFGAGDTMDPSLLPPLKETLPISGSSALQHLTIDCISSNKLLGVLDIYSDPQENILLNKTLPALKALRLHDMAHLDVLEPEPGWEPFRRALEKPGITVGFDSGDCRHPDHLLMPGGKLPRGGTCPALWRESFEMQVRGRHGGRR